MLAPQLVLRRVGVVDVVGRIAKGHVRELAAEHPLDVGQHRGVAAQQAVVAQHPEVARLADRLLGRLRDLVLGIVRPGLAVGDRQQPLELGGIEADQVEIEALVPEPGQLRGQQLLAPAGLSAPAGCQRSDRPASAPRSGARTGSPAPRRARACGPPAAGRGRRGCRPARRPAPGWSSRTRPSTPRSGRPAPRCACAGCARTGAGGRSATARSGRRARPVPVLCGASVNGEPRGLTLEVRNRCAVEPLPSQAVRSAKIPATAATAFRPVRPAPARVGDVGTRCESAAMPTAEFAPGQQLRKPGGRSAMSDPRWGCRRCPSRRSGSRSANRCDACDGSQAGSHPQRTRKLRISAAFRPPVRRVGANCEPGIAPCR